MLAHPVKSCITKHRDKQKSSVLRGRPTLYGMHYLHIFCIVYFICAMVLLVNMSFCVSILAHFQTAIIVCGGSRVLTESTTLFYQPLHLASHKL